MILLSEIYKSLTFIHTYKIATEGTPTAVPSVQVEETCLSQVSWTDEGLSPVCEGGQTARFTFHMNQ